MNKKIGFIGFGNMGSAIYYGAYRSGVLDEQTSLVYDKNSSQIEADGVNFTNDMQSVFTNCEIVILAVKPNQIADVLSAIEVPQECLIVSIAAGIMLKHLQALTHPKQKIVRVMPNTPALVNAGMCAICGNTYINDADLFKVQHLFEAVGSVVVIDESQMDAVVATSGSSPAYVFMFLHAMIETAQSLGLPYAVAKQLATKSLIGAATMAFESEHDMEQLTRNVCSPGGTTIEAVQVFKQQNFEAIIKMAMLACADKSRKMSEQYDN